MDVPGKGRRMLMRIRDGNKLMFSRKHWRKSVLSSLDSSSGAFAGEGGVRIHRLS